MRRRVGAVVEVDTLDQFDALVAAGTTRMRGWRVQDVDLRERTSALLALDPPGSVLLGCDLTSTARRHLLDGGALIFPDLPELPFEAYRGGLYTPIELYAGIDERGYQTTPDALIYAWSRQRDLEATHRMAEALHDHAIETAVEEELAGLRTVGVMGGHETPRSHPDYRAAAILGRGLTMAGVRVATGGGPGAMEAANLGAYLAAYPETVLDDAIRLLATAVGFRPSISAWVRAAFAVRRQWPDEGRSLGIPTWFYGHEPPNVFASAIAKYFQNSVREDTLLRHCTGGIVFLPGAAGTVQEIFQDACENFYADAATVAPMVLVGSRYWTKTVPVWPLLTSLAARRPMADRVHLVDDVEAAIAVIGP